MTNTTTQQLSNYEMFLNVVNDLKNSQGFYSRLALQLNELDDEQKNDLKNYLNGLPQFKDSVDVVMLLEC